MNTPPPPVYTAPPEAAPRRKSPVLWIVIGCFGLCVCSTPILAAIVFPVFAQAKIAAQRTECLKSIKSSATALLIYTSDHDDCFPPANKWTDLVKPYSKEATPKCPVVKDGYGYAMADAMSKKPATLIDNPDKEVLLFETFDLEANAHGNPKSVSPPVRHLSQSVAYANGAARTLRAPR